MSMICSVAILGTAVLALMSGPLTMLLWSASVTAVLCGLVVEDVFGLDDDDE